MVQSLLGVVDCNVRELVHTGYGAIFQPGAAIAGVLTAILTIYVAIIGYRLLLGRAQLRVSDFALNAVKLGIVIVLATQWDTYQTVVYEVLFHGPEQLAGMMVGAVHADSGLVRRDVFDGLQRAFDELSGFADAYAAHAPAATSPLVGGSGFAALLLTASASILLLSSLGVLLVAKIVLGLLLAVGPLFIALLLFESTRGVFEGWLRASLAFAFAPLAVTVLLAFALTLLEPALLQIEDLQKQHIFTLAPAYGAMTLILVFAGVSFGALIAGGVIAAGFRLPRALGSERLWPAPDVEPSAQAATPSRSRALRVAAAVASMDRRDTDASVITNSSSSDRRTSFTGGGAERGGRPTAEVLRLGQQSQKRRIAAPRAARASARTVR
jgi:type IV secretion system protein VirB6